MAPQKKPTEIGRPRGEAGSTLSYAAPDALRAARALVGLTQTQMAATMGMSQRSLSACETGPDATLGTITALRRYYERRGIEFLGRVRLETGWVHGSGAYWGELAQWCRGAWKPSPDDAMFIAARALLGLEVQKVAAGAGLTSRQVANLESGGSFTQKGYDSLRDFFEESGVDFLSYMTRGGYIRLGVRRASELEPPPVGLWVNRVRDPRTIFVGAVPADWQPLLLP
ncbi:helix-turn-helix transcriptional regulator [Rhizobium laguerreae]|uniref:helix-turn-helix domain-containing protein n=1 Tax=Rhizobium laguerreae TaxID=1076926 RepID=UPI001C90F0D7|nr:helix-turn-helix transcriptional regulator [Rhizobium laguerreae]MBY3181328.1 helix-turn-helix transcriptional regulator [Rhizobium laguerreae]